MSHRGRDGAEAEREPHAQGEPREGLRVARHLALLERSECTEGVGEQRQAVGLGPGDETDHRREPGVEGVALPIVRGAQGAGEAEAR